MAGDHFVKFAYLRATSTYMIRTSLSSPNFLILGHYGAPLPKANQPETLTFESSIFCAFGLLSKSWCISQKVVTLGR